MPAFLKNKTFWGSLIVAAVTLLALFQGALGPEWAGYRFGEILAPKRAPNPQVVVVAIDEDRHQAIRPLALAPQLSRETRGRAG